MNPARLVVLALLASPLSAQRPEFRFVSDLKIDLSSENLRRGGGMISVSPSGRIVFLPEFYRGRFRAFDSTGKDLDWSLAIGRSRENEIGWAQRWGWVGDSLWIDDQAWHQLVVVDPQGVVARSVEEPSWVRPRWGDRRRFPLFAGMEWRGVLPDGSFLVLPQRPRALFDTPHFDRDRTHLLRVDADGVILGSVASVPPTEGRIQLRDGAERRWQRVDFFPRSFMQASNDGRRVAVVSQSRSDSGAFTVTMLGATGDTIYARGYRATTLRIPPGRKDTVLRSVQPFGQLSADAIRDTVRKLMADFEPPVVNLSVGIDGSAWVWLREPGTSPQEWTALILDAMGNEVGIARMPRSFRTAEVTVDRAWAITRGEKNEAWIERFRREPVRAARASRTARRTAP